jgi:hypothetical protein
MSTPTARVIAKAWTDSAFRDLLLADPRKALESVGIQVPEPVKVTVLENDSKNLYFVLPPAPTETTIEEAALEEADRATIQYCTLTISNPPWCFV